MMFEKARLLNLLVCAVFGLAGGAASHLLLNARAASAHETSRLVRTERLEILDATGKVAAVFGREPRDSQGPPSLTFGSGGRKVTLGEFGLYVSDGDGTLRLVLGYHDFPGDGPARDLEYQLVVYDRKGNVNHRFR